ncbi:MAG: hypothetical protein AB7P02_07015 [Alphaproteobacteria bacterium]
MRTAIIAIALTAFAVPALAQDWTPGIDRRQAIQEHRIDRGVANGSISPREAYRLDRGQRRIEHMERAAKADGVVTRRERRAIRHAQDRQNARIHRQATDWNGR